MRTFAQYVNRALRWAMEKLWKINTNSWRCSTFRSEGKQQDNIVFYNYLNHTQGKEIILIGVTAAVTDNFTQKLICLTSVSPDISWFPQCWVPEDERWDYGVFLCLPDSNEQQTGDAKCFCNTLPWGEQTGPSWRDKSRSVFISLFHTVTHSAMSIALFAWRAFCCRANSTLARMPRHRLLTFSGHGPSSNGARPKWPRNTS